VHVQFSLVRLHQQAERFVVAGPGQIYQIRCHVGIIARPADRPFDGRAGVYTRDHERTESAMSTYLYTFRPPADYTPSAETFSAWATWQLELGARLKDRGNPGFTSAALGASLAATTLGGYSLIRAGNLDAAVALAKGCPMLGVGGAVEICELASHDDRFDNWLDTIGRKS
jgi:hypothetical protein